MEYKEHYDNLEQRSALISTAESNSFRMIHDDFDSDWERGDEPHGTLTFSDVPPPEPLVKPKLVFSASPSGTALGARLTNIETFLKELYPE